MDRSIGRLADGRIEKIISRLRAKGVTGTEAFVRKHYVNTAGYGKFNTEDEANAMIKLLAKDADMTTTSTTPTLEQALVVARQAEQAAEQAHKNATEALALAAVKLGDSRAAHADAKAAAGKAKLADAIATVNKVIDSAPAGSAAIKDVNAMLERAMMRRLKDTLGSMPHEGVFSTGRSVTATNIANATTSVGAGQPRQAKASPVEYKAGDKVTLLKAWYAGSYGWVGKTLTVDSVSRTARGTFLHFKELRFASIYSDRGYVSAPLPRCTFPLCGCIRCGVCNTES